MYILADYLVDVIKYMGSDEIFGVPGDYNLDFLDHITNREDMKWAGNSNELNAAYMADGYARKKGFASIVTTFGVGDLSSDNGLAGSLAENVPVLSIVGAPKTDNMDKHLLVHHTFGDGEFTKFTQMHKDMGLKVKDLSFNHPVDDINEIVKYMIKTGKPAYITLPIDVAKIPVSERIKENIPEILDKKISVRNENKKLVNKLISYLNTAQKPVVLVGHEIKNLQLGKYVEKFIKENKVPFTDLALGKCAVNEGLPQFIGTYNGELSDESIKKVVDSSDLILSLGAKLTDFVTAMFTQSFDERKMISLNNNNISVFGESENYMDSYDFRECISELSNKRFNNNYTFDKKVEQNNFKLTATDKPLTQDFYDKALVNSLNQGETLVAESGTSFSGLSLMNLGNGVDFVGQPLWASIGYSFPAMIGSQLADKESRHILSTGEGSLQLTIQELGMLLKKHLDPVVFVINNNGYTVERLIHGMNEYYNDVPELDYTLMPKAFGANNDQFLAYNVNTEIDLINALKEISLNKDKFILIQVNMKYNDAPSSLAQLGEMISNKNGK